MKRKGQPGGKEAVYRGSPTRLRTGVFLSAFLFAAAVAMAYFTATGSGVVTTSVTTLSAPGSPTATASGSTATITWSASTIGGSVAATSYTVERYSTSGTDLGPASCSPVSSSSGSPNAFGNFTCTDSPGGGSHKYTISASYHSWTATTGFTNTVTGQSSTSLSAGAPSTGTTASAISASSITSTLSGGATPGGTITFTVFGPQPSAPSTCTSGGTTVGTATVSGNGTYNPSGGYTPPSAGTYWWYASYGGDANNSASASTCGSAMPSTVVTNAPTLTASAPSAGTPGTAITAGSIGSTLSGATGGASGTITFTVFGPQASAPSTCTSGGTTVGTATVAGNATYNPSAGFTPPSAGTYWWYASYNGDTNNASSASTCGAGMTSTVVNSPTTTTVSAPATGTSGTAIATGSISSVLSGGATGATGTITYSVFGPQTTAPTNCSSGGTTVGTSTVSGNATYHPSAAFTPSSAGVYWWYASYSGDTNNSASNSACGAAMTETVVYSLSSVASATTASAASSTTSSFTIKPNTAYLMLISRVSATGDSVSSFSSTSLSPALSTASLTQVASQSYNSNADWQWAYYFLSSSSASGTGTITVNFAKTGTETYVDLVALSGASTATPVVIGNVGSATASGTSATANLPGAPATYDAGIVLLGSPGNVSTGPTASPAMTSLLNSHATAGSQDVLQATPDTQNETLTINSVTWATLALEISAPLGYNGNTTTTSASAPSTDTVGTAIAASSISGALAGSTGGAGGTVTFSVFGPQASAPTTCSSGGTVVGTATVSGDGTYNPSAGFSPSSTGTYWWYASYSGDLSSDQSSASTCGSGMAATVVGAASPTLSVSGPATDTKSTAIATTAISSALANATTGATGTITYTVFGPQTTAPTNCSTGGTTVGTSPVSGNATYHPSAAFTPSSTGTYWWYASYNGDANDSAATSTCGSAMPATYVYSITSAASANTTTSSTTSTTSSFAIQANTPYLLLITRVSATGDSVSSFSSTSLTPALSTSSFTQVASQNYSTGDYQWAYYFVSSGSVSGTGTITVNFAKKGTVYLDLVALAGANTTTPVVTGNVGKTNGSGTSATANLPSAPASGDAGLVLVGGPGNFGTTTPATSPVMTNLLYQKAASGSQAVFDAVPANQNETATISSGTWATLALEIAHP